MALELTGRLMRVLDMRTGMGKNGEWKNQDFIMELPGQYPRQVCISLWGDKTEVLKNFNIGDQVKAFVDVESREFNEKWYTSVKAWQLEKVENAAFPTSANNLPDMPPPPVSSADIPPAEEEMDDLPF
jgi:hypothetical protein